MLFAKSKLSDEEKMAAAAYYYQQKAEKKAAKKANKEKTKKAKDKKKGEIIFHDFSEESKKAEAVYDKLQKAAEEEAAEIAAQKADESEAESKAEEAAGHEKEKKPEEKKEQTEPKAEEAKKPAEKPTTEEKKEDAPPEPATEAPVEPADAEKVDEPEPEPVNSDAMKTAPEAGFNTGFKIDNFVQKATPKPTPQQVTPAQIIGNLAKQSQPPQQPPVPIPHVQAQPVSVGGTPIVPSNATPSEKCDAIRASIMASVGIAPVYDPKPDLSPKQKLNLIKKNISFMTGAKRQLDVIQLCGLIGLIEAPILKIRMEEYGAVDRTNNPKLVEIPIESHEAQQGYDMKFSVKLKNKAETMFVLFSSVPDYNDTLKSWNHAIQIYKK